LCVAFSRFRLIVDLAEANIKQLDAKVRREKETAVILGREQARLRQEMECRAQQVARVGEVLEAVQSARDRADSHPQATSLGHLQGERHKSQITQITQITKHYQKLKKTKKKRLNFK
jgi:hypothetical protein